MAADGTIGGSLLTMDQAVRNCVEHTGVELAEALRMAVCIRRRLLEWIRHVVSVFKQGECLFLHPSKKS